MPAISGREFTDVDLRKHTARLADARRLAVLEQSGLLDGVANAVLDRVARLAAGIVGVPMATVTLVDDRRQHFPGMFGVDGWVADARGTTLAHSFCQYVVANDAALVVSDATTHPLVRDNLAVSDLGVMAYAGVPLRTTRGENLGALCAIDRVPVAWTPQQLSLLEDLAAVAVAEIELRATVKALHAARERLTEEAERDLLTGLINRRGFAARLRQQLALSQRTAMPFSIMAISLDDFRHINARFGHEAGDHALIDMGALLSSVIRDVDVVSRVGDDEFVLLLAGAGPHEVTVVRSRVHVALQALNEEMGREHQLSVSIGVACWTPEYPQTLATMRRMADELMYAEMRRKQDEQAALGKHVAS